MSKFEKIGGGDDGMRHQCDQVVQAAARAMADGGADMAMILDRMMTFATAQAVLADGSEHTAEVYRHFAARLDDGVFAHLDKRRAAAMN